jgi:hypothetical protein
MRREDLVEMFQRIPEAMHAQVNLVLRNQFVVSIDAVARFEPMYLVARGREGGTSDEGRGFFVPYDEICYIRIERPVRLGELKTMYGETGFQDMEDRLDAETAALDAAARQTANGSTSPSTPTPPPTAIPVPVTASDPASIARQNLLDRIRAARANVAGTTGKLK